MMFASALNQITRNHPRGMVWAITWAGVLAGLLAIAHTNPLQTGTSPAPTAAGHALSITPEPIPAPITASLSQPDPHQDLNMDNADAPPWLNDAIRFVERFEGRRQRVYRDSMGHPTIGVGFNLDRNGAAEDIRQLLPGLSYQALRRGTQTLTDEQIDRLLRHDVLRAIRTARSQFDGFDHLPTEIKLILVDMTFNTGSLHKWRNLRNAIKRRDYDSAANAMYRSLWRRQTGRRARHHIALMRSFAGR